MDCPSLRGDNDTENTDDLGKRVLFLNGYDNLKINVNLIILKLTKVVRKGNLYVA